jgi:hypothetical protein
MDEAIGGVLVDRDVPRHVYDRIEGRRGGGGWARFSRWWWQEHVIGASATTCGTNSARETP